MYPTTTVVVINGGFKRSNIVVFVVFLSLFGQLTIENGLNNKTQTVTRYWTDDAVAQCNKKNAIIPDCTTS